MNMTTTQKSAVLRHLGNGLILRRATPEDAEALGDFNAMIHSDDGPEKPDDRLGVWTRDLLTLPHPTFSPGDFTVVEDTATGKIVSSINLISQTWAYEGIPFGMGRPELVGTDPAYRNRGLVRVQFETVHEWSHQRGELVQGVTGIPYYYRQFGYEMGLELGGGRAGFGSHVPKLKEGEAEPYRLRPATEADAPFLTGLFREAGKRQLVSAVWDEALWRYEIGGKSERNVNRLEVRIIERAGDAQPVGALTHPWMLWGNHDMLAATNYELLPGVSWLDVTPSVIRYLWQTGGEYAEREKSQLHAFGFWHGSSHPVYELFGELLPRVRQPYAWYVRVADLPGFIRHIAPALEKRLEESYLPGFSGEARISFYRSGLRLAFENGKLTVSEPWQPGPGLPTDAGFPDLTFLSLVFGRKSFDELHDEFPDCWWDNNRTHALLNALFPKKPSSVMGVV